MCTLNRFPKLWFQGPVRIFSASSQTRDSLSSHKSSQSLPAASSPPRSLALLTKELPRGALHYTALHCAALRRDAKGTGEPPRRPLVYPHSALLGGGLPAPFLAPIPAPLSASSGGSDLQAQGLVCVCSSRPCVAQSAQQRAREERGKAGETTREAAGEATEAAAGGPRGGGVNGSDHQWQGDRGADPQGGGRGSGAVQRQERRQGQQGMKGPFCSGHTTGAGPAPAVSILHSGFCERAQLCDRGCHCGSPCPSS